MDANLGTHHGWRLDAERTSAVRRPVSSVTSRALAAMPCRWLIAANNSGQTTRMLKDIDKDQRDAVRFGWQHRYQPRIRELVGSVRRMRDDGARSAVLEMWRCLRLIVIQHESRKAESATQASRKSRPFLKELSATSQQAMIRTPSISKKMTFIFFLTFLRSHSRGDHHDQKSWPPGSACRE